MTIPWWDAPGRQFRRIVRWAGWLALPALVLGVGLYPDIQQRTMPVAFAAGVLAIVGVALLAIGRARYLVLLPLIAAFLPSMQAGFVAYAVALVYALVAFGPARLLRPLDGLDWALLAVLLLALVSWLVNLGSETDLWSLPFFALTFLSPWLLLFVARAGRWSSREVTEMLCLWLALAASQVAPALVKPLVTGMTGAYAVPLYLVDISQSRLLADLVLGNVADLTSGSMRSAHHLGLVLLVATMMAATWRLLHRNAWLILLAVVLLFVFLMTDSKHVVLASAPAAAMGVGPLLWPRLGESARRVTVTTTVLAALVAVLWAGPRIGVLLRERLWEPYATLAQLNPKLRLVLRTEERLSKDPLALAVGYGPGSFASRAATIRATDVLFKAESQTPSFIPPHTGDTYGDVARGLYTSAIARSSRFRSGALTNPFSSLVGIIAEFGLVGSAAMLCLFGTLTWRGYQCWQDTGQTALVRAAGAGVGFAVPLLVFAGAFDSYFEQPDVTAPIVTLALVVLVARDLAREPAQA